MCQGEWELTRGQDVDGFGWEDDEWVNHSELLGHQFDRFVAWLLKSNRDSADSRLHTPNEEVVCMMKVLGACVWRRELLDDVVALRDAPIELEAIHRAKDVVIVIVSDNGQVLIAIHTELLRTSENVESVDLTNFRVAFENSARIYSHKYRISDYS